jgi:hypothetical protein
VQDGLVGSRARVSAGIAMMLACIAPVAGADTAGQLQLAARYCSDGIRSGEPPRDPRGYGRHHWRSQGTPSLLPSILTPGQFFRNQVASSQERICEQYWRPSQR